MRNWAQQRETILTALEDGVLRITLNRPDKLNAYNPPMQKELIEAFLHASDDDQVGAIVVTGAGRGFCAGADIGGGGSSFNVWGAERAADPERMRRESITLAIYDCKKPVIAALNGAAVGVGITMCLPMDVRLAAREAKIGFVFNKRGMAMEAGSSWFLPRLVGMQQAQLWVNSAEIFDAAEAQRGGLVHAVYRAEDLLPAAHGLARKFIADRSAVAAALNRQLMWKMLAAADPVEALQLDMRCVGYMAQSADAKEGIGAFFAKRKPEFPMKASKDMPSFYPWWRAGGN